MLVQENLEKVDETYIKELYSTLAMQYLIFRYNIRNEFNYEETLDSVLTDTVLTPRIVDKLSGISENDFNVIGEEHLAEMPSVTRFRTLSPEDRMMLTSIDIALDASALIREYHEESLQHAAVIPEPEPPELPHDEELPIQAEPASDETEEETDLLDQILTPDGETGEPEEEAEPEGPEKAVKTAAEKRYEKRKRARDHRRKRAAARKR